MQLKDFAENLAKASPVGPDSGTSGELAQKMHTVDEYKAGTATRPVMTPHRESSPADRVNPGARYGDRGAEQRIDVSEMTKDLPSHHDGTSYVDHTGPAMLEKGEAVVKKEDNPMHHIMEGLQSELGTPEQDKIPAKKLHKIETRKAGDGHIHVHHYTHPEHHKPTEHATHGTDGMVGHMMEHMSSPNPGESEADEGQHGIPEGAEGME